MTGLTVATWNIHKGVGGDRRRDLLRTASVIAEITPDIMTLQEADTRFGTRRGLLDLKAIAREQGLVAVPMLGLTQAHGWHGNVVLLRDAEVEATDYIDLPGFEPRGAMIVDLTHQAKPLRVIGTHLGLLVASRKAQVRHLLACLAKRPPRATLLMGDLNEWRVDGGTALAPLRAAFPGWVSVPSFPARYPLLPLDRIMATGGAGLSTGTVHGTEVARRASDHLPVVARLEL
ncbi:MAG: endonuclease/exonuclease/phosphatase family protein [Pseudotabrizicola sp.]|uniref:endonuclease/exonuclease/phosphatase family protein n=1 Tax=Pseudotabrizicola sp. TaxID=2939647 RepID=UPI002723AC98|nr:endonuclease/exonuclease/phosphatase family protein [Pseudotabrizicola sp.]MDO9639930.1 endonuclease/exonuclease/phosphatase family protein [Pseudotabrizicola sp.]